MFLVWHGADGIVKPSEGPINFSQRGQVHPPRKIRIAAFEMVEGNNAYNVAAIVCLAEQIMDVIVIASPDNFTHPEFLSYHSVLLPPTDGTKGFLILFREATIGGNTKNYLWDRKPMTNHTMDCLTVDIRLEANICHRVVAFQSAAEESIRNIDSVLGYMLSPNERTVHFVHLFCFSPAFNGHFEGIMHDLNMVQLIPGNSKLWSKKLRQPQELVSSVIAHKPFNVFNRVVRAQELEDGENAPPKFTMNFEPLSSRKIAALTQEDRTKMVDQQQPLGADENNLFGLHLTTTDNKGAVTVYRAEGPHPDGKGALLLEIGSGVNTTPVFLCEDDCAEITCNQ